MTLRIFTHDKHPYARKTLESIDGYRLEDRRKRAGSNILYHNRRIATLLEPQDYNDFKTEYALESGFHEIWTDPDAQSLMLLYKDAVFILEICHGDLENSDSIHLQTCDFKRKQIQKLLKPLGVMVQYVYILNEWFRQPRFKNVLDYMETVNCHYKFDSIPLKWLGLPEP